MSTESGIPDFRSATGIWAEVDPFEVASIDAFRRDPLPRLAAGTGRGSPGSSRPSRTPGTSRSPSSSARGTSARSSRRTSTCSTHARGSADVVEVHGSIARFPCLACHAAASRSTRCSPSSRRARRPICHGVRRDPQAGCRHVRRAAPGRRRWRAPSELAREAGLLLVVGSSLQVWPVAGLPADRSARAGRSRSSTTRRRRTTRTRTSSCAGPRVRRWRRSHVRSMRRSENA